MRRLIASLLAFTFIFAIASCGNCTEPEDTGTTSTETATLTTETSDTTGTTTDKEYGPERVTEEPDYGDGQIADICELMKSVTGKKIVIKRSEHSDIRKDRSIVLAVAVTVGRYIRNKADVERRSSADYCSRIFGHSAA